MQKEYKDEMIVMLKRENVEMKEQLKVIQKTNEELKKGDTQAETKIKALNEMHSQKIKTLLKSIQNLKKEVQKEKYQQKDNVRAQIIERYKKDIEYQEQAINALRKVVCNEDRCDSAIKQELEKGPKRIRVASREELKIDINKYKNMTLRLLEELKKNGIKQPAGIKVDQAAGTGLKEDKEMNFDLGSVSGKENQDLQSSQMMMEEGKNNQELQDLNDKLEEKIMNMNIELKDKNEKILDILNDLEELKIQVYARDKSIELQQKQIEELLEELRESKSVDNDIKILVSKKIAIEEENQRLRKEIDEKFVQHHEKQFEANDLFIENRSLLDQIKQLKTQLETERNDFKLLKTKIETDKTALTTELAATKKELSITVKQLQDRESQNDNIMSKLNLIDGQASGVLKKKDEDMDAYRNKVIELQTEVSKKDNHIADLETKIVELSTEVQDKEFELEFYSNQVEEIKEELETYKVSGKPPLAVSKNETGGIGLDAAELDKMKKRCKLLMIREAELQEQIDQMKAEKQLDDRAQTVKNIIDRDKQRSQSRGRDQQQP